MVNDNKQAKSLGKKILVVEDEKPIGSALEMKLKKAGYLAKAVFNGTQALKALETEKYHLVLLDLLMPDVDGFDVLEKLKAKGGTMPPIVVTSNLSQQEDIKRAKDLGVRAFLVKSDVSLEEIVSKVKSLVG